jgi:hypothetical protein
MMRIGLVGENPNDTISVKNLLLKNKSYQKIHFEPIAKKVRGSQIANTRKLGNIVESELTKKQFHIIIFINDLDGLPSHKNKIKEKQNWFNELNKTTGNKGIFLLNIFELEALILSDIECFNKIFKTKIKYAADPMYHKEPKEFLIKETKGRPKKYSENDCPAIFKQLDIKTVAKNCKYFKEFLATFDARIKKAA